MEPTEAISRVAEAVKALQVLYDQNILQRLTLYRNGIISVEYQSNGDTWSLTVGEDEADG